MFICTWLGPVVIKEVKKTIKILLKIYKRIKTHIDHPIKILHRQVFTQKEVNNYFGNLEISVKISFVS